MIKLVTLLVLVAVVVTMALVKKVEKSPEIALNIVSTPTTDLTIESSGSSTWKTYRSDKQNFIIKYPDGLQIKTLPDGETLFSDDSLSILISQQSLSSKDTVNTIAEQAINDKMEKLGDKFTLVDAIAPIALGSQTGITFGARENGQDITYYYLPQGFNYLEIENRTVENKTGNLISLSDNIIYSLEIINR